MRRLTRIVLWELQKKDNATHLCSPLFFLDVFKKVSTFPYPDSSLYFKSSNSRLHFFSQLQAESLAQQFRSYTYASRTCSLRSHSVKDTIFLKQREVIVNESLRLILEFIFMPYFITWKSEVQHSHVLSSCYSSLQEIVPDLCYQMRTRLASNSLGFGGEFDSINLSVCLSILRRQIKDHRFLTLINDFLLSNSLQKSLDSPVFIPISRENRLLCLLSDIYYFEFDKFILRTFRFESRFHTSPILGDLYKFSTLRILHNLYSIRWYQSGKAKSDELKYLEPLQRVKVVRDQSLPCSSPVIYYRYLTHWVVFLSSNSLNLGDIKSIVFDYILHQFSLTHSNKICHDKNLKTGFLFLGFSIKAVSVPMLRLRASDSFPHSPFTIITPDRQQILNYLFVQSFITKKNFFPIAKRSWVTFSDYEIICNFRKTFLEFVYYYKYSDSLKSLSFVHYLLKFSCAKTLAYKHRISLTQVFTKYGLRLSTEKRIYLRYYYKICRISFPALLDFKKV